MSLKKINMNLKKIIQEEVEKIFKEISTDTFKSALNVSKDRGTDHRTQKLGGLFFNKFIGMSLLGGIIKHIFTHVPQQANYRTVQIEIEKQDTQNGIPTTKKDFIYYDIDKDFFDIDFPIDRTDAVILSKIALHINPTSKFKETGKYFIIKGH